MGARKRVKVVANVVLPGEITVLASLRLGVDDTVGESTIGTTPTEGGGDDERPHLMPGSVDDGGGRSSDDGFASDELSSLARTDEQLLQELEGLLAQARAVGAGADAEVNKQRSPDVMRISATARQRRRRQDNLARLFEKIADDLSSEEIDGDECWHMPSLMRRRVDRRSLGSCRVGYKRESLVLILDTSGSCAAQSRFFSDVAQRANQHGLVEVLYAPNAYISGQVAQDGSYQYLDVDWPSGRTIVFFGDWDGQDRLVEQSRSNDIYWFSCEHRFDQCELAPPGFRGRYYHPVDDWDTFNRCIRSVK